MLKDLSNKSALIKNADMSRFTTVRAGGCAAYLADIGCIEDLLYAAEYCAENGLDYKVIGRGSNIIVSDSGYSGVIIRVAKKLYGMVFDGTRLSVSAGESLKRAADFAADNSMTGLEWAEGIPGTIGGAAVMNAGAFGRETADIIVSVSALADGVIHEIPAGQCGFKYRDSVFLKDKKYLITGAVFNLEHGGKEEINKLTAANKIRRYTSQPKGFCNAGSTFKRFEGQSAGEIIDKCGLKGCRIGGAEVSGVHANFLINKGNATASDFISLMRHIELTVENMTGKKLEREIEIIGSESLSCG